MKKPTKKLQLNAETIRVMTNDHLQDVAGGSIVIQQTRVTCRCPVLTNGCTTTIYTSGGGGGPSINPGPIVVSGG